jgi:hypothetical protein
MMRAFCQRDYCLFTGFSGVLEARLGDVRSDMGFAPYGHHQEYFSPTNYTGIYPLNMYIFSLWTAGLNSYLGVRGSRHRDEHADMWVTHGSAIHGCS